MAEKSLPVQYFHVPAEIKDDLLARLRGNLQETYAVNSGNLYITSIQNYRDIFCLNKTRKDNIPKISNLSDRSERKLRLGDKEGLMEKSYFAVDEKSGILVLQCNGHVCRSDSFANILAGLFRHEGKITPVSLNRSLLAMDRVADLELKVRFPKGTNSLSNQDMESNPTAEGLRLLAEGLKADSTQTISVGISAGRNVKRKQDFLGGDVVLKTLDFAERTNLICQKAIVTVVDEDESGDPAFLALNMMGTLKKTTISVSMDDKYPNESDMADKLLRCLHE